jgi:hypothetical protein
MLLVQAEIKTKSRVRSKGEGGREEQKTQGKRGNGETGKRGREERKRGSGEAGKRGSENVFNLVIAPLESFIIGSIDRFTSLRGFSCFTLPLYPLTFSPLDPFQFY